MANKRKKQYRSKPAVSGAAPKPDVDATTVPARKGYTAPKGRATPSAAQTAPPRGSATGLSGRDVSILQRRRKRIALVSGTLVVSILGADLLAVFQAAGDSPAPVTTPTTFATVTPSSEPWSSIVSVYIPPADSTPADSSAATSSVPADSTASDGSTPNATPPNTTVPPTTSGSQQGSDPQG